MPISRKDFEKGNFKTRHNDRKNHPVAVLLRENKNLAFNVKEIVKRVKMKEDTVRSMLRGLKQDGLVVHRQPFFAWKVTNNRKLPKKSSKKRR